MAHSYSPLRYPGGKSRLTYFIELTLRLNGLEGGVYVEPFAGGAGIAMALILKNKVSKVLINDIDPAVHAFWFSVLNHTDELCEKIENTPVDINNWYLQRSIFQEKDTSFPIDLGFATFFLNRTNRSGILSAGVIGGLKQTGNWKIDARFPKERLIGTIREIAKQSDRIKLTNHDARKFLRTCLPNLGSKVLVYLDPPYFHKGQKLYLNALEPDDHVLIAHTLLREMNSPWIVSYDNTPEISGLYSDKRQTIHSLNYTAARRYHGSEIIIYSDDLFIPDVSNPFMVNKVDFSKSYKTMKYWSADSSTRPTINN